MPNNIKYILQVPFIIIVQISTQIVHDRSFQTMPITLWSFLVTRLTPCYRTSYGTLPGRRHCYQPLCGFFLTSEAYVTFSFCEPVIFVICPASASWCSTPVCRHFKPYDHIINYNIIAFFTPCLRCSFRWARSSRLGASVVFQLRGPSVVLMCVYRHKILVLYTFALPSVSSRKFIIYKYKHTNQPLVCTIIYSRAAVRVRCVYNINI